VLNEKLLTLFTEVTELSTSFLMYFNNAVCRFLTTFMLTQNYKHDSIHLNYFGTLYKVVVSVLLSVQLKIACHSVEACIVLFFTYTGCSLKTYKNES